MADSPTMHGRPWQPPELVILARGAPEEAVLDACKVYPHPTMGPNTTVMRCEQNRDCSYVFCVEPLAS